MDRPDALRAAVDALEQIALAGMSGSGQESEEGLRDWHARRAWEFIGIAARALPAARAALALPPPQDPAAKTDREWFEFCRPYVHLNGSHEMPNYAAICRAVLALAPPAPAATPSSHWHAAGEADPHAGHYDRERAALTLGSLTDDELANGAFMNYDQRLPLADMLNPKPGQHMPIVWMTAVKDRIRWLSRALERATVQQSLTVAETDDTPLETGEGDAR